MIIIFLCFNIDPCHVIDIFLYKNTIIAQYLYLGKIAF